MGPDGLPGYGGDHHARRQFLVVLSAYDVAAIVAQRDVWGLGVKGTCVCGRHRDDAQVPDVPEGGVQVVDRRPVRIQVTDSPQNNRNRQNTLSDVQQTHTLTLAHDDWSHTGSSKKHVSFDLRSTGSRIHNI